MNKLRLFLGVFLVAVCVTDTVAQIRMSKTNIAFGSLRATTSKVDSFYVKDTSATGTTITAAATATGRYVLTATAGNLTPSLAAGDSVWYKVTFTPDLIGVANDTVAVTHAGGTLKLPLSGTGTSNLDLSKVSIAFGSVRFTITKRDSFYVKNPTATGSSITALANAYNRYTVSAKAGSLPVAIAAADSAWFYVDFAPNVEGAKADTVVLTHALGALKLPLSGTGTNNLDLSKASIDYGNLKLGSSKKDSFYVRNAINPTSITAVANALPIFVVTAKAGNMTPSLAVGDTVWYYVTFTPDTILTKVDTVVITHPEGTKKVALRGTGITPLDVSKASIAFGNVLVTSTKKDSLFIKNATGGAADILAFSNRYPARFVVTSSKGTLTPTIAAGDSAWYYVTYASDTVAAVADTLVFKVAGGFHRVPLTGTGLTNLTTNKATITISTYPGKQFIGLFLAKNIGSTPIVITAASLQKLQYFSVTSDKGTATPTLAAGDSTVFTVSFLHDSVSTTRDTLDLWHAAGRLRVPLAGVVANNLQVTDNNNGGLTTYAFGNRVRGVAYRDSVKLKNFGLFAITINSISNAVTSIFTLEHPTLPLTLNPNQEEWMYIRYSPLSNVLDRDTIKVVNDDPTKGAITMLRVVVTGRALASLRFTQGGTIIDFDAVPKDFLGISYANSGLRNGTILPGVAVDSAKVGLVTLANGGLTTIRVDSITFTKPYYKMITPFPFEHRNGTTTYDRILRFQFKPTVTDSVALRDTMFVWTNDTLPGGSPLRLFIKGFAASRTYVTDSVTNLALNFGNIAYGSRDARVVTVRNYRTGTALVVDSVNLRTKNPKFSILNAPLNRTYAQGQVDSFRVQFWANDTAAGPHRDTLQVYTAVGATKTTLLLPISAGVQRGVIVTPAVTSINVGDIPVSSFKDTTVRFINATKKSFNVLGITLTGGTTYTILSNTGSQTFNEGDTVLVTVRFAPASGGQHRDTIVVSSTIDLLSLTPNPYRIALSGTGNTNAVISSVDYVTVDNATGVEGFNIQNTDSSYMERGIAGFWQNVSAASFGGNHRRTPNLSGSANGSSATYTFTLDSSGTYLVYHYMVNSPNAGVNNVVYFRKFGLGVVYDSLRYTQLDNNATGFGGTWFPLRAHVYDGVGATAAQVTIAADAGSAGFMRVDAVRMLRTRLSKDLEFGRRDINFGPVRVPEESPQITVADTYVRNYRLWNLGTDTLKVTNLQVFPTTTPLAWHFIQDYTPATVISIPPMSVTPGGSEIGGFVDIPLAFSPFQEGTARDSLVITSNDEREPNAFIILLGTGVNLNFVLNASGGGVEPHFRAPSPPSVPTIPLYREFGVGWVNSTAAPLFPVAQQNLSSRVNLAPETELPHQAQFQFELPDNILGIDAFGTYYLEHNAPVGSPNGASYTKLRVTHTFGVPVDSAYFSTNLRGGLWDIVGGATKTFTLSPGGPVMIDVVRDLETNAIATGPFLRVDLLRVRKIPTDPVAAVNITSVDFSDVNIKNPAGPTGQLNKRTIKVVSRGEKELQIKSISLRSGQKFGIVNPPPFYPYPVRAVVGEYVLTLAFTPDKIQPGFADTMVVQTNGKTADSLIVVPLLGNGVGGSWTVNDDSPSDERSSHPILQGLYGPTWDASAMNRWQTQSSLTPNTIGLGQTRRMLAMKFNTKGFFEWYPLIDPLVGGSDSIYVRVVATMPLSMTTAAPAARYKVYSAGGNLSKDTVVNQNGRATAGGSSMAEIDLGSHWFLRGGRDAYRDTVVGAGAGIFGHVRVEVDTASANVSGTDTLSLVADALILRELETPSIAVGVESTPDIPTAFALDQNYPNPFNPSTSIRFALPSAVNVELKIYDLLGREVRTLIHGQMNAGFHSVVWNGRNEHQQSVATGVYFYRIVAGEFRQVKKMLMVK